jgi:hypothetical protein
MRLGRSSSEDDCECWFTPAHFLEALERERQWFEMLMLAGLSPGASPAYQVRMMFVERSRWLRN